MMKARLLILISFFTIPVLAQQQESGKKLWTLKECVDQAVKNNIAVRRSEYTVESRAVDYNQAKLSFAPSINGNASSGYNWGRGLDPVTNQFVSSQRIEFTSVGAQGSLPLFNGLRLQNTLKQTSRELDASQYDLAKARNDVSLNVVTFFVNVVFAKEQVANARLQLQSSEQQFERTKKLVAAGTLPQGDALNLEAQVASNELNLVQQENALALALLQLQQVMQIPASENFDVEVPDLSPGNFVLDQGREEIFNVAKGILPEVKSASLKVESSEYAIKASRGNLVPRLSLNASINSNFSSSAEQRFVRDGTFSEVPSGALLDPVTRAPIIQLVPNGTVQSIYGFSDQMKDNLYKSMNISLIIPILNGYQARSAVQRNKIANKQAELNQLEVDNTLRQNVETAYNNALAASKTYNSALKQVQAREEAFRIIKQRYDIGAANFVEYQVSENDLFRARTDLARAKYDFIFRKKLLDFYQGKPLEF